LGTSRTAIAISAGDLHTCALLDNATVKCWGASANGRLGTGDTLDIGDESNEMGEALLPISLGTGVSAVAISAGGAHTCVLLNTSDVKCFGNGTDGRLGYGNQNNLGDGPGEMGDALATVNLGTGRTMLAVSAGLAHTCAMLDDATVKCWGNGGSGRRGSGNTTRVGTTASHMGDNLVALSAGALINTGTTTTTTTTQFFCVKCCTKTATQQTWCAVASWRFGVVRGVSTVQRPQPRQPAYGQTFPIGVRLSLIPCSWAGGRSKRPVCALGPGANFHR